MEGFETEMFGVEFVNDPQSALALGFEPVRARELARAWISAHPDVDIVVHADAGLEAVAEALAVDALYGDVFAVGFEMTAALGDYIRDGLVGATFVRDRAGEAAAAAGACGDFLLAGVHETGPVLVAPAAVTAANVDAGAWELREP